MQRLDENELSRPPLEVLEILCKLGKGSYGSVYKARYKQTGEIVAVKKVPVDSDLADIVKEISIMQQCDSPYIVKCFGSLFDNQDLWICMEYCGAGSVADIMRLRNQTLHEDEIATVMQYSLRGLDYLHQMRKIHRDIKAGNILLTNSGNAKLADFGVAGQLSDTLAKRNTVIGTPYWMAPEVIQEVGYDCSADIWSLGITAVELADGKPPLGDIHPMRALFMIPSKPAPSLRKASAWSPDFHQFVTTCLAKAPEARPTAQQLSQTDFIRNAKPCGTLISLITEANAVRERRLAEARNASARGILSGSRRVSMENKLPVAVGGVTANRRDQGASEKVPAPGTQSSRPPSMDHQIGLDPEASRTLISVTSQDSSNDSNLSRRRSGETGNDDVDSMGTMVINESSADEEEDEEDDDGSVVVHGTQETDNPDEDSSLRRLSMPPSPGGNGTLTRKHKREAIVRSTNDAAGAAAGVAAAQRDCGFVAGVPPGGQAPAHLAQRPFAPISRALQESGLLGDPGLGGNPMASQEPGALGRLTSAELEHLLLNLGRDLETELRNLAVRYRHKRQPLLDAIAEKSAVNNAAAAGRSTVPAMGQL